MGGVNKNRKRRSSGCASVENENFPIGNSDDPLGLDTLNQDSIIPDIEENEFCEKNKNISIPQNLNDPLGLDKEEKKGNESTSLI